MVPKCLGSLGVRGGLSLQMMGLVAQCVNNAICTRRRTVPAVLYDDGGRVVCSVGLATRLKPYNNIQLCQQGKK